MSLPALDEPFTPADKRAERLELEIDAVLNNARGLPELASRDALRVAELLSRQRSDTQQWIVELRLRARIRQLEERP